MSGDRLKVVDVTEPVAITVLLNPRALRFLEPFLAGPSSLSKAAEALGVRPSAVAYWLPKFSAARLVIPCDPPHRSVRSQSRWYVARGHAFRIAASSLALGPAHDVVEAGRRRALAAFYDSLELSDVSTGDLTVQLNAGRIELQRMTPRPSAISKKSEAALDGWLELRLTHTQAVRLKQDLLRLVRDAVDASSRESRAARTFLAHVGLVLAAEK